jgi:hypothetical protein
MVILSDLTRCFQGVLVDQVQFPLREDRGLTPATRGEGGPWGVFSVVLKDPSLSLSRITSQ